MNATIQIPAGYMMNIKGHLIPTEKVKPIEKIRDEVVKDMVQKAQVLHNAMQNAKTEIFAMFNDFVALSAQEYDTKIGGEKGNVTLFSFDGLYKVQLAISENLVFDERLQVAKHLIDECIVEWSAGSNDNIKALINNAFQVDKQGKISTHRVLGLRRLDIRDEKWLKAIDAISDAIQVTDSKEYIRFYERDAHGKYQPISLDFASI
ncbi:DUF3164 family protein [Acinetobacter sp. c1-l78]|uniref:DUF3164 family protein n=1 Tax=Acinetobacter sp. c1-l78 TaxID=3342803 RepID=UPI0035B883C3